MAGPLLEETGRFLPPSSPLQVLIAVSAGGSRRGPPTPAVATRPWDASGGLPRDRAFQALTRVSTRALEDSSLSGELRGESCLQIAGGSPPKTYHKHASVTCSRTI